MWETFKKEWKAQVALILLIILTIWWFISPLIQKNNAGRFFGDFPSIYGVMALWGGIWGIIISQKWGGLKSIIGKAMIFFSLGLFAQIFGQVYYAYLSFYKQIEVPYPSLGDIGYFGSIPLYIVGVLLLAKASGVTIGLKSVKNKLQAIIIPVIALAAVYIFFLQGYEFDWSNPLKIFLDFGYPFGQAIYVSLALLTYLLSRGFLGGVMKSRILFILFALCIQFASDFTFLYQSSKGTWSVGGINDYMYLLSYFAMTLALIHLKTALNKLE
jgi:drug/metabolite transporter superfamily protein YnfA